jgi:S1-C subfamily serine protease
MVAHRRFWINFAAAILAFAQNARAADEPRKDQPAPAQNGPSALAIDFDFQVNPVDNTLSFIAATHGNPLGVEVSSVDNTLAAQLGLPANSGVVVTRVTPAADAASPALAQHDVVLKIGDRTIANPKIFNEIVKAEPGKELQFHVVRQTKPLTLGVKIPQPPVYALAATDLITHTVPDNQYRIGVTLSPADDTLRAQLRLASGEGLVVTDIVADGPAAKAGVKKHDVLILLDGKRLTTVEAINSQVQSIKDRKVTVVFIRGGQEMSRELAPKLSTAAVTAKLPGISYENVFLQQLQHSGAVWTQSAFPHNVAGVTSVTFTPPHVHWAASNTVAADQIAGLKKQLAEMQKTLQTLEAALERSAASNIQSPDPAKKDAVKKDAAQKDPVKEDAAKKSE